MGRGFECEVRVMFCLIIWKLEVRLCGWCGGGDGKGVCGVGGGFFVVVWIV